MTEHHSVPTAGNRPVTLFTGQWADLPLEEVAAFAAGCGYDGLEIAVSGEHLDAWRAAEDDGYVRSRREILDRHGLGVWAISNHLKGQAVCDDPIDFRHQAIVGPRVWGDGDPEGVRRPRRRRAQAHGCSGPQARSRHCCWFHGIEHLALRGHVPPCPR